MAARIASIELPNKRIEIALTYLYGIGRNSSKKILNKLDIGIDKRANDLTDSEITSIRREIEESYIIEGDLKAQVQASIKRLLEINCYRGNRHRRGLPVNGQRTKTNAHTRKGRGKTIPNKKIATK